MKLKVIFSLIVFTLFFAGKADKRAYKIYSKKGKASVYNEIIKSAKKADVVLFGELHNNAISHWLEYELAQDFNRMKSSNLIIGAEMFESDQQLLIDEYIEGVISKKNFDQQARLWPNHETDYAPILDFAAENDIDFIATNIPRRYASIVNKKGFGGLDSLSKHAKMFIAPLPIPYDPDLECYAGMLEMMGMPGHRKGAMKNLPKAQASKDATMAHFIVENFKENHLFYHFNGAYHSDNFQSIVWYLNKYNPDLKVLTITTVEQENINLLEEENKNKADFIFVVDKDVTKTY